MLTKEQALMADEFHFVGNGGCSKHVGLRNGVKVHMVRVRRNGATKTWKTKPNEWRLPVKYGMYDAYSITQRDAENYHTAADCPLLKASN